MARSGERFTRHGTKGGAGNTITHRTAVFAFTDAQRRAIRRYNEAEKIQQQRVKDLAAATVTVQLRCVEMHKAELPVKRIKEITGLSVTVINRHIETGLILMGEERPDEQRKDLDSKNG